jgi:hypothetical protein
MSQIGQKGTSSQWLYILLLLGVMHVLMDGRYQIVSHFPSRVIGFGVLGVAYLVISLMLFVPVRAYGRVLSPFDHWIRRLLAPYIAGRSKRDIVVLCSVVVLMIVAGCWLRWLYIKRLPIEPRFADMLPLIQCACDSLEKGMNPYGQLYPMPWKLPLTFWPGLWVPYLIPHMLSIDIRWVHIVAIVAISMVFVRFLVGRGVCDDRTNSATKLAAFAALFLFLFSTEPIFFASIAHTPPQWLWISLLALSIVLKRPRLSAVLLGIVLSSRQTAVVYGPLMAIYWLRTSGSFRTAAMLSVVAAGTFLVICGPFLVLAPHAFVVAPVHHYSELGNWDFSRGAAGFSADTIGLSYMIRSAHMKWLLPAASAIAVVGPWLLAWKYLRSETEVLLYLGVSSIAVALTAPIPWHYEYFPAFILIAFASIAAAAEEDTIPPILQSGGQSSTGPARCRDGGLDRLQGKDRGALRPSHRAWNA